MPLSVRELNKSTRYQHIVSAAQRLFLKLGLDSVQMQDVANEAEVGIATVFRYFPKKINLLLLLLFKTLKEYFLHSNRLQPYLSRRMNG